MPTVVYQRYDEEGECPNFPVPCLVLTAEIIREVDQVVMAHVDVQRVRAAVG